ncbi:hypothetical protein PS1_041183 [Malus domestica]
MGRFSKGKSTTTTATSTSSTCYELKCESSNPDRDKQVLENLLKENGIRFRYSEVSKFAIFRSGKLQWSRDHNDKGIQTSNDAKLLPSHYKVPASPCVSALGCWIDKTSSTVIPKKSNPPRKRKQKIKQKRKQKQGINTPPK